MSKIEKGGKYGKLTALEFSHRDNNRKAYWSFQCSCGTIKVLEAYNVFCGNTKSCGCNYKESNLHKKYYKEGTNLLYLLEQNTPAKKNNKTGIKGIYYDTQRNKYAAQIMYQGKRYALGRYNTPEEAEQARKEAEEEIKDGTFLQNWDLKKNRRKR